MHAFIIYNRHISILLLIATPPNFACVDSGRCIGKNLVPAQAAHGTHRATSRYGNSIQSRYKYQWNISERDNHTNTNITYLDHPRSKYQYASIYIIYLYTRNINDVLNVAATNKSLKTHRWSLSRRNLAAKRRSDMAKYQLPWNVRREVTWWAGEKHLTC